MDRFVRFLERLNTPIVVVVVSALSIALYGFLLYRFQHQLPARGDVVSDRPDAGFTTTVAGGSTAASREASAAAEAVVPKVVGLSAQGAEERLAEVGLGWKVETRESSEEDDGRVLEQSVAGGKEEEKGPVTLVIGSGSPQAKKEEAAPAPEPAPQPAPAAEPPSYSEPYQEEYNGASADAYSYEY